MSISFKWWCTWYIYYIRCSIFWIFVKFMICYFSPSSLCWNSSSEKIYDQVSLLQMGVKLWLTKNVFHVERCQCKLLMIWILLPKRNGKVTDVMATFLLLQFFLMLLKSPWKKTVFGPTILWLTWVVMHILSGISCI